HGQTWGQAGPSRTGGSSQCAGNEQPTDPELRKGPQRARPLPSHVYLAGEGTGEVQGPAGTREPSVHCVPCPGGTLEMRVPVSLSKRSWPKTEPHLHAGLCPALYAP
uniref:Uncharacterized protein n=1 Tax=Mustela putorius furo TaxID=9669 RepID=M3YAF2_MUSPF